jgi:hypothetical protein
MKPRPSGFISSVVVVFELPIISLLFVVPDLELDCCCCCSGKLLLDSVLPSYFIFSQSFSGAESFCVRLKSVMVSFPVPQMNISLPGPPVRMSLPGPSIRISSSLSPYILSFPSPPSIWSFPTLPFNTSRPSLP